MLHFISNWPLIRNSYDPARQLKKSDVWKQRIAFLSIVFFLNAGLLIAALVTHSHTWVFVFILFVKSKDCGSALISAAGLACRSVFRMFKPLQPVGAKWILTFIPAYSESEEQIIKTIFSLRDNDTSPHCQVMFIVLDGKTRDIRQHMTHIVASMRRPYITSKFKKGDLIIDAGFMVDVPVILIEKVSNAGKKDSLILCHDLFNSPRGNAPLYTKLLRQELWEQVLPQLTHDRGHTFLGFDMIFCADADSTVQKGGIRELANALARDKNAIAACGLVLVEVLPGEKWRLWNLYQQFQYTYGQFVRRRAEGLIRKVTCLPGCITMVAVREEMQGAISKYAAPITSYPVIFHQVQYLGTDRRLTYAMLSQGKNLHTLFVPEAVSETAAPQSLKHYLSQRRRWGSNAYFNDYFYAFGTNMILITRIIAVVDVLRLSSVYYRIANSILFIDGLVKHFEINKIIALLVITQTPAIWFAFSTLFLERNLRKRAHTLAVGFIIDKFISPLISVTIFTIVAKNLGSQGTY